jgi:hypothetical protein
MNRGGNKRRGNGHDGETDGDATSGCAWVTSPLEESGYMRARRKIVFLQGSLLYFLSEAELFIDKPLFESAKNNLSILEIRL